MRVDFKPRACNIFTCRDIDNKTITTATQVIICSHMTVWVCVCMCMLSHFLFLRDSIITDLHFWAWGGNGSNGVWANGGDHVLELLCLDGSHFLGLVNLQLILLSNKLVLGLPRMCQTLQFRFLSAKRKETKTCVYNKILPWTFPASSNTTTYGFNLCCLCLESGLLHGCLPLYLGCLGARLSFSLGLPSGLHCSTVSLQLQQLLTWLLRFCFVCDLLSFQSTFGFLLKPLGFMPEGERPWITDVPWTVMLIFCWNGFLILKKCCTCIVIWGGSHSPMTTFVIIYLAAASWELVVISMASWTDFWRASLVRWSTGSTDWMSMLVTTRLFAGKQKRSRTLFFSSKPNTEARIILAEF